MFRFARSVLAGLISGLAMMVFMVTSGNAAPVVGAANMERAVSVQSKISGQSLTPVHYRRYSRYRYRPYRRYRRRYLRRRWYRSYYRPYYRPYYRRRYYRRHYYRPRAYYGRRWRRHRW